jgi:hypothetical protein
MDIREWGGKKQTSEEEVNGNVTNLHNRELYDLYCLLNIIQVMKSRRMGCGGHVVPMGETEDAYRLLVGKPEGRRPPGIPRRRWKDNIKTDLKK